MNSVKIKFPNEFTDESFYRFCRLNEDLQMEREADGRILVKNLTSSQLSSFNAEINTEVNHWNRQEKPGKVLELHLTRYFHKRTRYRLDCGLLLKDGKPYLEKIANALHTFLPILSLKSVQKRII